MSKWDRRFMELAEDVATWSKDRSTKVGSVIVGPNRNVVSTGYNGLPRGMNDDLPERHERPLKGKITIHSELNSLLNASSIGASTRNCKLYCTLMPCANCACAIVQGGIIEVLCPAIDRSSEIFARWGEDFECAIMVFKETGVVLTFI